ncbi:MAG: NfeD family protein [Opitutales bacterium]
MSCLNCVLAVALALFAAGAVTAQSSAQLPASTEPEPPVNPENPLAPENPLVPYQPAQPEDPPEAPAGEEADSDRDGKTATVHVYAIPITEQIGKPNMYILRRALKKAIEDGVDMVILDMDTPGGRVDITIEMMEMLAKFEGITATYVNDDAISGGSFIAAATQEIYFAPSGKMGASGVIQGGGQEVPETVKQKIQSYLRANVRAMTDEEENPYRADVIRAMLDGEFEFKIGEEVIKPKGELLTLTAKEALKEYGDPPRRLLSYGTYDSLEALLDARFEGREYTIHNFELTYSEVLAKWMNAIAPGLMGLGALLLFIEFKTPGFGVFGIAGLTLLGVFFLSQHIAGLAGNEPILFFALGIVLVLLELFLFPGLGLFAVLGLFMIFGSLLWAMVDIWPEEGIQFSAESFGEPVMNLTFALTITLLGAYLVSRFVPGSRVERALVLGDAVGGGSEAELKEGARSYPEPGTRGIAVTDLYPSGHVEIEGKRYDARSLIGTIEHGTEIEVVKRSDFGLVVKPAQA